jgi:hypothetical protein
MKEKLTWSRRRRNPSETADSEEAGCEGCTASRVAPERYGRTFSAARNELTSTAGVVAVSSRSECTCHDAYDESGSERKAQTRSTLATTQPVSAVKSRSEACVWTYAEDYTKGA